MVARLEPAGREWKRPHLDFLICTALQAQFERRHQMDPRYRNSQTVSRIWMTLMFYRPFVF